MRTLILFAAVSGCFAAISFMESDILVPVDMEMLDQEQPIDTMTKLKAQFEQLKSQVGSGAKVTPGVEATVAKMITMVEVSIESAINNAHSSDQTTLNTKMSAISMLNDAFTTQEKELQRDADNVRRLIDDEQAKSKVWQKQTRTFRASQSVLYTAFEAQSLTCCERDKAAVLSVEYVPAYTVCDYKNQATSGGCAARARAAVSSAVTNPFKYGLKRYREFRAYCDEDTATLHSANTDAHKQFIKCDSDKNAATAAFKLASEEQKRMQGEWDSVVSAYNESFTQLMSDYEATEIRVRRDDKDRTAEWGAAQIIKCMLKAYQNGGKLDKASNEKCAAGIQTKGVVDIGYPKVLKEIKPVLKPFEALAYDAEYETVCTEEVYRSKGGSRNWRRHWVPCNDRGCRAPYPFTCTPPKRKPLPSCTSHKQLPAPHHVHHKGPWQGEVEAKKWSIPCSKVNKPSRACWSMTEGCSKHHGSVDITTGLCCKEVHETSYVCPIIATVLKKARKVHNSTTTAAAAPYARKASGNWSSFETGWNFLCIPEKGRPDVMEKAPLGREVSWPGPKTIYHPTKEECDRSLIYKRKYPAACGLCPGQLRYSECMLPPSEREQLHKDLREEREACLKEEASSVACMREQRRGHGMGGLDCSKCGISKVYIGRTGHSTPWKGGTNEEFDRYDANHDGALNETEQETRAEARAQAYLDAGKADRNGETPPFVKVKSGYECKSKDTGHGKFGTVEGCAAAVAKGGGKFFIYGIGSKAGACYTEHTTSETCYEGWESGEYDFYEFDHILRYDAYQIRRDTGWRMDTNRDGMIDKKEFKAAGGPIIRAYTSKEIRDRECRDALYHDEMEFVSNGDDKLGSCSLNTGLYGNVFVGCGKVFQTEALRKNQCRNQGSYRRVYMCTLSAESSDQTVRKECTFHDLREEIRTSETRKQEWIKRSENRIKREEFKECEKKERGKRLDMLNKILRENLKMQKKCRESGKSREECRRRYPSAVSKREIPRERQPQLRPTCGPKPCRRRRQTCPNGEIDLSYRNLKHY